MPYGILKCDQVTFTNAGVDQTISVSGIVASISGNITATGTISGNVIRGGTTISGATVTGTAGQFGTITGNTAGFTTVTGTTVTGSIATFTSGAFTYISGGICTLDFGFFTSGTAASPSITFQGGDVNTGIYSPGADQVAISTGGSGRLFVDASGRVGVGRTPVAYGSYNVLDLAGSAGSIQKWVHTGSTVELQAYASSTLTAIGSATNHPFIIVTNDTERLRITSAGLVGVGTSSPGATVDVVGNGRFLYSTGATNTGDQNVIVAGATTTGGHASSYGSALQFQINNSTGGYAGSRILSRLNADNNTANLVFQARNYGFTDSMTLDANGRLGVGTASPGYILDTSQSFNSDAAVNITNANTGTGAIAQFRASNGTSSAWFGIGGTNYTSYGQIRANGAAIYTASAAGIGLSADNASGFISFGTGAGAGERARIDSSGRFLVGTSTSITTAIQPYLQVQGTGENAYMNAGRWSNDANGPGLLFGKSRGGSVGTRGIVANGDILGEISFYADNGSSFNYAAAILSVVDGTPGVNDMPGRLVFSTTADGASSPTERMRIDNVGAVSTYTTGAFAFVPGTSSSAGTTNALLVGVYGRTGTTTGGSESIKIFSNGNIQNVNNSYGTLSDLKLKENIVDAGSQWADLKAIQVRNFNFKEGQTHRQIGVIAQEIEQVSPGLVYETPDRDKDGNETGEVTKGVNYSVLYMKAVKALQEAMERIETLEAKVAALENA